MGLGRYTMCRRRLFGAGTCAMLFSMDFASASADAPAAPLLRDRADIPQRFKWNLHHIFADWAEWEAAFRELDSRIGAYAALQGTLDKSADHLLTAMRLSDEIGQL